MKNKILIILVIAIVLLTCILLAGCNKKMLGNYKYTRVHILYPDYEECLEVNSWAYTEEGIEVDTKEYGDVFISEGHYLLCKDACPICESRKHKK